MKLFINHQFTETKVTNLDEVTKNEGATIVRTNYGTSYPADMVLRCTGNTKTDLSYAWGLGMISI